jgi:hypothetical protein
LADTGNSPINRKEIAHMMPKYCDQCHHLYVPEGSGLRAVFCKACYLACEQAYLDIRRFLQENPGASTARVAIVTGVPTAFVYHLFRLGRFGQENPIARPQTGLQEQQLGICQQCGKALSVQFDAICEACDELSTAKPTADGVASAFAAKRTPSTRRRRDKNQYGFNRYR